MKDMCCLQCFEELEFGQCPKCSKMKITKVKLCDDDACYCMGSIECKEKDETFEEKLERAYLNSKKKNE